ncbi:unnamed protein product, partial [Allacma fusca]
MERKRELVLKRMEIQQILEDSSDEDTQGNRSVVGEGEKVPSPQENVQKWVQVTKQNIPATTEGAEGIVNSQIQRVVSTEEPK